MFAEPTFRTRVIQQFSQNVNLLRERFDAHFRNPNQHTHHEHFKWNYWYVPDHYMYLRASLSDIVGNDLFAQFMNEMQAVANSLSLNHVSAPFISLYVNGCFQHTHSDMMNGTYAYVFSLTDWSTRSFTGGETMVARENIFDKLAPREHRGQTSYWDPFPAHFNQLLLMDDRLAHHVPIVQGLMDPRQGRVVLHGHIY